MSKADYPFPSTPAVTAVMKGNRRRDTAPELRIRRLLHRRGLRFRVDRRIAIRPRSVRPDIVFGPARVAVFVDGCFWHGCPTHGNTPRTNAHYWPAKLDRNRERDVHVTKELEADGWVVLRFWEHEDPESAAKQIEAVVSRRRSTR